MSNSLVDRILVGHSLDGSGPSHPLASRILTSGFIRQDGIALGPLSPTFRLTAQRWSST